MRIAVTAHDVGLLGLLSLSGAMAVAFGIGLRLDAVRIERELRARGMTYPGRAQTGCLKVADPGPVCTCRIENLGKPCTPGCGHDLSLCPVILD